MSNAEPNSAASETGGQVSLASYELIGKLARGGMGTVYVARRAGAAGFQRFFAVKLMHDHLADHDEFVQMFLDEARIAARLHHPNVVPIVDMGEVDGRQFVVMDYIEGCSLDQLFRLSPDNRPLASIVKIFSDFLMGLHAAHELCDDQGKLLNLVHRDVSPQNVLIGTDGGTRITDFGIAKAEERLTSTRPGLRKGKLAFMAPEQLYDEALDRRADIFSAGALLWSALTGEKLFAGSSDAATMRNLLQLEILPPSQVGLKPPPYLDEICLKALSRDPAHRFQSASDMAQAIREVAIAHRVFGTESDVSGWLTAVAGEQLQARRAALYSGQGGSSMATMPVLVDGLTGSSSASVGSAAEVSQVRSSRTLGAHVWLALLLVPLAVVCAVVLAVLTHASQESVATNPEPTSPKATAAEGFSNTLQRPEEGERTVRTPVPAAAPTELESPRAFLGERPGTTAREPRNDQARSLGERVRDGDSVATVVHGERGTPVVSRRPAPRSDLAQAMGERVADERLTDDEPSTERTPRPERDRPSATSENVSRPRPSQRTSAPTHIRPASSEIELNPYTQ